MRQAGANKKYVKMIQDMFLNCGQWNDVRWGKRRHPKLTPSYTMDSN